MGIAFSNIVSRCLRIASAPLNSMLAQLKTIQGVIALTVFAVFSVYLGEKLKWNYAAGAACLVLGGFFVFHK